MPFYSSVRRGMVSCSSRVPFDAPRRLTSRVVLDEEGKSAFQNYLNEGGNFVGIHSASDSLNTTAFFGQELGQRSHGQLRSRRLLTHTQAHTSTTTRHFRKQ